MTKHRDIPFPDQLREEADTRDLRAVWDILADATPEAFPPERTDRALEALRGRLGSASGAAASPPRNARVRLAGRYLLRAAAVVALAVGAASAWYAVPVSRTAAPGERVTVALPDGSSVELNSGSTLAYRRGFRLLPGLAAGSRQVRLEGEAFFRVKSGVRPFRVVAGDAEVRVLGTRFNVRSRPWAPGVEAGVRVEVEEGRVEVWGDDSRSLILSAGEAARVAPGGGALSREAVAPERIGLWRTGGLTVVDEPLSSILTELSLRFGVRIVLSDPTAGTSRLSVYYPEVESVESVLADLATQQDLRYRRTNDGWELF